jgi:threonylcarbamoyladenosine tRNA methylthiotransferase MtaB
MPDAAIGADVMVGFPGETDSEFEETRAFIERLPFTYLHVFPYSERPGTPAAECEDQVPEAIRKARGRVLKSLGLEKNLEFRRGFVGRTLSAVTIENGRAVTSNYLTVELAAVERARRLIDVEIGGLIEGGLRQASPFLVLNSAV